MPPSPSAQPARPQLSLPAQPSRSLSSVRRSSPSTRTRTAATVVCLAVAGGVLSTAPATATQPASARTSSAAAVVASTGPAWTNRVPAASASRASVSRASVSRAAAGTARTSDPVTTPAVRQQGVPTLRSTQRLQPDGTRAAAGYVVAELPQEDSRPFETIAVTWAQQSAPDDVEVDVRVRRDETWTAWQRLEFVPDEGPSADEEADVRDGTIPWWTGPADGVSVRVSSASGKAPRDVSVVTIDDPQVAPASAGGNASSRTTSAHAVTAPAPTAVTESAASSGASITHAPKFPALPRMVTRGQWGANESLRDPCFTPRVAKTAKMVFIHHTVNDNGYSRAESPAVVRGIYAYHTQGQGWCDIGYNFLVDRFGTVYQGRKGGIRRPVRGSHAGDYNVGSVGISMIGDFQRRYPSDAMKNALVRLVGWKLGTSYRAPRGHARIYGDRFKRISGHRDAMQTACPGNYGYAWLPTLRRRVSAYLSRFHSLVERKAETVGKQRTGAVHVGEVRLGYGRRTVYTKATLLGRRKTGVHALSGVALTRYRSVGGATGPMRLPVSDLQPVAAQDGVRVMAFDHGRMYLLPGERAKALWGRILLRWAKLGGFSSRLGAPRTSVLRRPYGASAVFAGGSIRYERAQQRVTVSYR